MGHMSIVTGYIKIWDHKYLEQTRQTIASYPFDEIHPFTNIFWCDSPASFFFPLVGITGSYRQIETEWSEWLWKFSRFLSTLEAVDAYVRLECIIGEYFWRLMPRNRYQGSIDLEGTQIGQEWGIVEAPKKDFSIDPEWLEPSGYGTVDMVTGELHPYKWDILVERWPKRR